MALAFVITTIAGLSTLLGSIIIFLKNKTSNIIVGSLSFASSIMLSISISDLIPESYNLLKNSIYKIPLILIIMICLNVGIIISMFINKFISKKADKLYRVGLLSMLTIIIHNIPEGMATFISTSMDTRLGMNLSVAIAMHNIPEGISIAAPIYYASKSKKKAIIYTFISGISEPFGAIIAYIFLKPYINNYILGILFSVIAGLMIYISLKELLPTSLSYNNKKITYIFFILGIIFAMISKIV